MMNLKMMKKKYLMLSDKSDYNKFKLYSYKVEDLINDYEQLKQLHEEIMMNCCLKS